MREALLWAQTGVTSGRGVYHTHTLRNTDFFFFHIAATAALTTIKHSTAIKAVKYLGGAPYFELVTRAMESVQLP